MMPKLYTSSLLQRPFLYLLLQGVHFWIPLERCILWCQYLVPWYNCVWLGSFHFGPWHTKIDQLHSTCRPDVEFYWPCWWPRLMVWGLDVQSQRHADSISHVLFCTMVSGATIGENNGTLSFDKLREAHVHKLHGYEIVPLPWVISIAKKFYNSWVIEVNQDFGLFYKNSFFHSSSKIILCTRDAKPCGFTTHLLDGMNIGVSKASMPSLQG